MGPYGTGRIPGYSVCAHCFHSDCGCHAVYHVGHGACCTCPVADIRTGRSLSLQERVSRLEDTVYRSSPYYACKVDANLVHADPCTCQPKELSWKCRWCDELFPTKDRYRDHVAWHADTYRDEAEVARHREKACVDELKSIKK